MKAFYLGGSIIFTALILVLAFENIGATCSQLFFFFFQVRQSTTLVILGISIIGVLTGLFYGAFLRRILSEDEESGDEF